MNEWRNYGSSTPELICKCLEVASIMDDFGENLHCKIGPADVDAVWYVNKNAMNMLDKFKAWLNLTC